MEEVKMEKDSIKHQLLHLAPQLDSLSSLNLEFPVRPNFEKISEELSDIKSKILYLQKALEGQDSLIRDKSQKITQLRASSKENKRNIRTLKIEIASNHDKIMKLDNFINGILLTRHPENDYLSPMNKTRPSCKLSLKLSSLTPPIPSTPLCYETPKKPTKKNLKLRK